MARFNFNVGKRRRPRKPPPFSFFCEKHNQICWSDECDFAEHRTFDQRVIAHQKKTIRELERRLYGR